MSNRNIKVYLATIFLMVYIIGSAACNQQRNNHLIQAIEVRDVSPLMGETFYRVYYMNDLILYQSQYLFDSSLNQLKFDSLTNKFTSDVSVLKHQWKDQFFAFHKDSSYGYNYDSFRVSEDNLRLRVDSVLKFIKGFNHLDSFLSVKPYSSNWNEGKTVLKELYCLPRSKNTPTGYVNFYYSKRLNHLKESFNFTVDRSKKMKLFKIEAIFEEFYSEKDKTVWPAMRDVTEMKEIDLKNSKEILDYFDRYKKNISKKY